MLAALVLAGLAVATLEGDSLGRHARRAGGRRRRPGSWPSSVLAALIAPPPRGCSACSPCSRCRSASRSPLGARDREPAGAAVRRDRGRRALAEAVRRLRRGADDDARASDEVEPDRRLRHLEIAFAVVLVLYGAAGAVLDRRRAGGQEHVPVLRPVRAAVPAAGRRARGRVGCCGGASGSWSASRWCSPPSASTSTPPATCCSSNAKVQEANDLQPYFRVNSLFFDPNIYGRFLALTMILLAATLLWSRRRATRRAGRGRAGRAVGGPRAVALAVELRGAAGRPGGAGRAALADVAGAGRRRGGRGAAAVALVLLAPGRAGARDGLGGGARQGDERARRPRPRRGSTWPRDRPLWGFGAGSFAERYRVREHVRSVAGGRDLAHDPAHRGRRAGGDRAGRLPGAACSRCWRCCSTACASGCGARRPESPPWRRAARGGGVLRARAAHAGVRGVPRGPPDVGAAGHRRRTAPTPRRLVAAGRGRRSGAARGSAAAV